MSKTKSGFIYQKFDGNIHWYTQQKIGKSIAGFTLVELLIVIVIIAILAAITIVAYNGIQARARDSVRKSDVAQITKALQTYNIDKGNYIESGSGCGSGGLGNGWLSYPYSGYTAISQCIINDGVVPKIPLDPSGLAVCADVTCHAYMKYTCASGTYVYANLETGTHDGTELNGTCAPSWATSYGMNYFVKVN